MRLETFLRKKKLTDVEFAQEIGVSRWAVYRWRMKLRRPRDGHMQKIHKATKGKVTYKDWYQ